MIYKLHQGTKQQVSGVVVASVMTLLLSVTSVLIFQPKVIADRAGSIVRALKTAPYTQDSSEDTTSQEGNISSNAGSTHAPGDTTTPVDSNSIDTNATLAATTTVRADSCTGGSAIHNALSDSWVPSLRKLAVYESVCNSAVASGASFFVPTPRTLSEANSYAVDVSERLKEFSRFGLNPLIFMEPTYPGGILDLAAIRAGAYDQALATYFSAIKSQGVTDSMMGSWVFFPEGNIPVWNNVEPSTFVANVTKVAGAMKQVFPRSKAALLLDSQTYPSGTNWSGGAYKSLLPYVQGIPAGLIDSFGLQGFPWTPPANQAGAPSYDPKSYLRVSLVAEATQALGVTQVWINTGTFSRAYASSSWAVTLTPKQRQQMLDGVLAQVKTLQTQGFTTSVHIFAEDKTATAEDIDWSYWPSTQPGSGENASVFKTFIRDARVNNVQLWIFDV